MELNTYNGINLGDWLKEQRRKFKNDKLTVEKITKLKSLDENIFNEFKKTA